MKSVCGLNYCASIHQFSSFIFLYQSLFAVNQKKKVTKQIMSFCLWTGESGLMILITDWFYDSSVQCMSEFDEDISVFSVIWC